MNLSIIQKIRHRGLVGTAKIIANQLCRQYFLIQGMDAEEYKNPTDEELQLIENEISKLGVSIIDYRAKNSEFVLFKEYFDFPSDYHGGVASGVYEEKLLEHYVAWDFLKLSDGARYLDIAGASSPWVNLLNVHDIEAYSVDLKVPILFADNSFYIKGDATATHFSDNSFDGASAQCAYEMFEGESDIKLLSEMHRILKPGGRLVISPLYTHTHACYYQTPDYWNKPHGDNGAKAYIRRDCWGIPASRKYSPETLKTRVIDNACQLGFKPSLYVLRNNKEIAETIYLHFILILDKPRSFYD